MLTDVGSLGDLAPSCYCPNPEYERQLGCEVIQHGVMLKLDAGDPGSGSSSVSSSASSGKWSSLFGKGNSNSMDKQKWNPYHIILDWDSLRLYTHVTSAFPTVTYNFQARHNGIQVTTIEASGLNSMAASETQSTAESYTAKSVFSDRDDILQVLSQIKPPPVQSYAFVVHWSSHVICTQRSPRGIVIESSNDRNRQTRSEDQGFVCYFAAESVTERDQWIKSFGKLEVGALDAHLDALERLRVDSQRSFDEQVGGK